MVINMADNRNDLKSADGEKSFGGSQNVIVESVGARIGGGVSARNARLSVKRRLPVFVDIIIGAVILAIFAGIVAGAYFLFRYYTDDYEGIDIEYVFISPCTEDEDAFRTMRNKELYYDVDGNTLYFGKATSVEVIDTVDLERYLVLTVKAGVKYKPGEGYTVGDCKIAAGSEYALRIDGRIIQGTVVELYEETKGESAAPVSAELEDTAKAEEGGN